MLTILRYIRKTKIYEGREQKIINKRNMAEVGQIFKNCHTSDKQVINARFYTNA